MADSADQFSIGLIDLDRPRTGFDCGVPALNDYFSKQLGQDVRRRVATAYVLQQTESNQVVGFYTLASASVLLKDLPAETVKKLPRYPLVPTTLLGRLAVSVAYRGRGFGERLLLDALFRSVAAADVVASVAVVVDAKDAAGAAFYENYGFIPLPDNALRLFIPMATLERLRSSALKTRRT